jgi:hypothetical protein
MKYINSFENFALFESMDPDKLSKLNIFLIKMDIDTRRITSTKFFDFYRNVIVTKFLNKFEKEVPHISQLLMMLRSSANNQNESRIVEYLKKIQTAFLIDDTGKTPWISEGNIKLHLNRSDSRKIGNIHEELLSLLRTWEILSTPDGIDSDVIDSKDSILQKSFTPPSRNSVNSFVQTPGDGRDDYPI